MDAASFTLGDPGDVRRRTMLALVATTLIAVPFTIILLAVTTRSDWLARLDSIGTNQIHLAALGQPGLWDVLRIVSLVTQPFILHSIALVVAIVLWRWGRRTAAIWLVVTILSGWLLSAVVKDLVQRARPGLADAPLANGYSFPSGHALNSMLFVTCMVILLNPYLHGWRRALQWVVAVGFVLLVGLDRIALAVHFISDVLGGWIIAWAVVAASLAAFGMSLTRPGEELAAEDDADPAEPGTGPAARATAGKGSQAGGIIVRLVPGWIAIWAVLVGLGLLVTGTLADSWALTAEDGINTYFAENRTGFGNAATFVMSELGNTLTIVAICVAVSLALWRRAGRPFEALLVLLCPLGQSLVFFFTSLVVKRDRPEVPKLDISPPTSSFPSGHTSASIALYIALAVVVHHNVRRDLVRRLAVVALVSAPVMVGLSRLYRGMHHPSDLVGAMVNSGLVILLTYATLAAVLGPLHGRRGSPERDRAPSERIAS